MLEVTFRRDDRGRLCSIDAAGHADFADYGQDVVCAAVSAILQAAQLGLQEHCCIALQTHRDAGVLRLSWPESARGDAGVRAIGATAELAVARIAEQYPHNVRFRREP